MRGRQGMGQVVAWLMMAAAFALAAEAQETVKPYDGLDAGAEAYYLGELRRRDAVNRQLGLIDDMKWWSGLPSSGIGFGYRSPSLGFRYAFPSTSPAIFRGPASVFEPWPFVPGDIWGYGYYNPVPQPIGQRQIQTGPNRWESHPVYATGDGRVSTLPRAYPLEGEAIRPSDSKDGPGAEAPLDAETPSAAAPKAAGGPREF